MKYESIGKKVVNNLYIHKDTLSFLASYQQEIITKSIAVLNQQNKQSSYNVIKINELSQQVSLLLYEPFNEVVFPALLTAYTINYINSEITTRYYNSLNNPPILHRKELLLPPFHPDIPKYATLTEQLEEAGLFRDSRKIGFKKQWERRLENAGYKIENYQLIRLNDLEVSNPDTTVERHKTALTRYALSSPLQLMGKYNFLEGDYTLFDYGCGKGSDIKILKQNKVTVHGWDPYFCPENNLQTADIVNLGFVVNVIENPDERIEALLNAYQLCHCFLSVAVMLGEQSPDRGRLYQDGVLTRRNTFQKYFSQSELREYLRTVLDEEPIAVGLGIFFIFKDKDAEQSFLAKRYRNRGSANRLIAHIPRQTQVEKQRLFYEAHKDLLNTLWLDWLELGRPPIESKFLKADEILKLFSTWRRGLNFLQRFHGGEALKLAFDSRRDDLTVYFAMRLFEQKRIYKTLAEDLQRDVKAFFSSYKNAQAEARELLFSTGNVELIRKACHHASDQGYGHLDEEGSLTLHSSLETFLPPILRVYIGCATQLYGDTALADLIKIHADSGKLSLMIFDDFEQQALPRMVERIKIRLFDQRIEFYEYGDEFTPPYLYLKSRFINKDYPNYKQQLTFDTALQNIENLDFSGHGMSADTFDGAINKLGLEVDEFELRASSYIPELDEACGQYHCFRDFIECGEKQAKTQLANRPKQAETYHALRQLAVEVIDPVMDYFGGIELTYGFCSRKLATCINDSIAPSRDQHASHEVNTRGNLICKRLGAACDFIIPDESMLEVAQWIIVNTSFDRLYFYGDDLPIHVSVGSENTKAIAMMKLTINDRLYPIMYKVEAFLSIKNSDLLG
jgi:DNA phosphorothioation-associated putative methyltransferase